MAEWPSAQLVMIPRFHDDTDLSPGAERSAEIEAELPLGLPFAAGIGVTRSIDCSGGSHPSIE
jgi:hypothetical protein